MGGLCCCCWAVSLLPVLVTVVVVPLLPVLVTVVVVPLLPVLVVLMVQVVAMMVWRWWN